MDEKEITLEELECFAAAMAQALPGLECPECCERGWKYQYVEMSAALYREEWEWFRLAQAMHEYRARSGKRSP